ncbi:hypothetical protein POM88_038215 [Heracleum sosnowskyi]|uniref:TF-B3 domain-containing protein n=1 Tax=Heracleum sosnowskyi TaxID=360622 RepID=A0AAD8MHH3_9APIA|nr:hypothetical protein POM88_038215 [Heracleum sosnowskyi]
MIILVLNTESEDAEQEEVQECQYLVNGNVVKADEINNNIQEFSATISKCHVYNRIATLSHYFSCFDRQWIVGEGVLLRTDEGSWSIGLTVNDGRARFSTGWNKFARDNELKRRQNLVFNMNEGAEGIVFEVTKLGT